ncbi:MAG: hypothetical protein ACI4OI_04215, partial [Gemmiger sp.]
LTTPMDKRLRFLQWLDYLTPEGGAVTFGVYDSEYRLFLPLPVSLRGAVQLRSNQAGTGWLVCNAEGTNIYLELRLVPPAASGSADGDYRRIANIGDQQLQIRLVTRYPGLELETLRAGLILME